MRPYKTERLSKEERRRRAELAEYFSIHPWRPGFGKGPCKKKLFQDEKFQIIRPEWYKVVEV